MKGSGGRLSHRLVNVKITVLKGRAVFNRQSSLIEVWRSFGSFNLWSSKERVLMVSKKLAIALALALGIFALSAPISIDTGSVASNAAFARGGDDGGCHADDHGPC
jgi:hypothetical protein